MKKLFLLLLLFPFLLGCSQKEKEFTVLQWNIWQEGTVIPGGYDAIVNEIARLRPDFVTLSEVRNYENTNFTARLVQSLKEKGETYYSFYTYDTGLLSRYPITDSLTVFPEKNDHSRIIQPHPIPALLLLGPHGRDAQDYQRMEATEDTV